MKFSSKYNGQIELVSTQNGYSVIVNNIIQSGVDIEAIWNEAFEKLITDKQSIKNVLILGFGSGSIIKPLRKFWPDSQITGVEIDKTMLSIAQEYFSENLDGVTLISNDAIKFVNTTKKTYDLIVVDCYVGNKSPPELSSMKFLLKLKTLSKAVLLNQLFIPQKGELQKIDFIKTLDKFHPVKALKLPYNIIICF